MTSPGAARYYGRLMLTPACNSGMLCINIHSTTMSHADHSLNYQYNQCPGDGFTRQVITMSRRRIHKASYNNIHSASRLSDPCNTGCRSDIYPVLRSTDVFLLPCSSSSYVIVGELILYIYIHTSEFIYHHRLVHILSWVGCYAR